MEYEVSDSKCAFLDQYVLINLQRFTAHSQIQFCARLEGWGSMERKAQFLHLRNSTGDREDNVYLQEESKRCPRR